MTQQTTSATLIPPPAAAKAGVVNVLRLRSDRRFFLLIVIGLVWLGAAFHDPRFYYGLAAWDGIVLIAWAIDLRSLPKPEQLKITRRWKSAAALSVPSDLELVFENASRITLVATVIDNVPTHLRQEAPELALKCRARGEALASYQITPTRRGDAELGAVYVRYQTPLRIAERWAVAHVEQRVCVYPNLEEARQHSVYLVRSRQIEMEKRHARIRGAGREFESLREYQVGDEFLGHLLDRRGPPGQAGDPHISNRAQPDYLARR